jgi:hypothetical protein
MVQRLLANKEDQYNEYVLENFESLLGARFHIERRDPLASGTRILYFATALRAR